MKEEMISAFLAGSCYKKQVEKIEKDLDVRIWLGTAFGSHELEMDVWRAADQSAFRTKIDSVEDIKIVLALLGFVAGKMRRSNRAIDDFCTIDKRWSEMYNTIKNGPRWRSRKGLMDILGGITKRYPLK